MKFFLTALFMFLLAANSAAEEPAGVVSVRVQVDEGFHRLTVELTRKVPFNLVRKGEKISLRLREMDQSRLTRDTMSTDIVEVEGFKYGTDGLGAFVSLDMNVPLDVSAAERTTAAPFRIMIDFKKVKDVAVIVPKKPAPRKAEKKIVKKIEPPKKPAGPRIEDSFIILPDVVETPQMRAYRTVTFNDGWRWLFRKKYMRYLIDASDTVRNEVFRTELKLASAGKEELVREARTKVLNVRVDGDAEKADELERIVKFFEDEEKPLLLEDNLTLNKVAGLNQLVYFLLADHYEKAGFYPEAAGYYSRTLKVRKDGFLRAAVLFRKARQTFLDGKFEEAKELFKQSMEDKYPEAPLWLAHTLLIKGEYEPAIKLYDEHKGRDPKTIDPLTRLFMGDMSIVKRQFGEAREIYRELKDRYPTQSNVDLILNTFLSIRIADTYLAEFKIDEAITNYKMAKGKLSGERWSMASLALADAILFDGTQASRVNASKLYQSVSEMDYAGTEIAYLSNVSTLIDLENYNAALEALAKFSSRYPTSSFKLSVPALRETLMYRWMSAHYARGEYYETIKLYTEYGTDIPFGKKADMNYKIGKSFKELGLLPDAVRALELAVKIGKSDLAEDAMMELGRAYFAQEDAHAAERLFSTFAARYPKSRHTEEIKRILFVTAYMKKDYARVVSDKNYNDLSALVMKADAFRALDKYKDVYALYERIFKMKSDGGDTVGALQVRMKMADYSFAKAEYNRALDDYKAALVMLAGDTGDDRAWALYRLAKTSEKLNISAGVDAGLNELYGMDTDLSRWSIPLFKEASWSL